MLNALCCRHDCWGYFGHHGADSQNWTYLKCKDVRNKVEGDIVMGGDNLKFVTESIWEFQEFWLLYIVVLKEI